MGSDLHVISPPFARDIPPKMNNSIFCPQGEKVGDVHP